MRSAEELTAIVIGLVMLVLAISRIVRRQEFGLVGVVLLSWGIPFLFGGLHFVWYSDLNWQGIAWGATFCGLLLTGIWAGKLATRSLRSGTGMATDVVLNQRLLQVGRMVAILTLIGVVGRVIHAFFVLKLPLFTDFAAVRTDQMVVDVGGSIWSRIGFLLFLWPISAFMLAVYGLRLGTADRVLLASSSLAFPIYGLLYAGRSPILITALFLGSLLAIAFQLPSWSGWLRRNRAKIRVYSMVAMATVVLALVTIYGLRAFSKEQGGLYSQYYDLSEEMFALQRTLGDNMLTEGLIGTIGYAGQSIQRLSEFFDLEIGDVYYGGWQFEFADSLLRRVGILEGPPPRLRLMAIYEPINLRYNTFATLARDTVLDFGMLGSAVFALLLGFTAESLRQRIKFAGRWEWAPVYGILFATVALSSLGNFLPEISLYASLAFAMVNARAFLEGRRQRRASSWQQDAAPDAGLLTDTSR